MNWLRSVAVCIRWCCAHLLPSLPPCVIATVADSSRHLANSHHCHPQLLPLSPIDHPALVAYIASSCHCVPSAATRVITIYLRERNIYSILREIIPGLKQPLANELLTQLVNHDHGAQRHWPLPLHVALGHPNQEHNMRHPHTMGDNFCPSSIIVPTLSGLSPPLG